MKHLIIKDRNLRKKIKKLDKNILLYKMLKKSAPVKVSQVNNRCVMTGRGKAITSFFKHSRIMIRQNVLNGVYLGVSKSS